MSLTIVTEIPEGGFTRTQLLNMITTARAAAGFVDGVTLEVTGAGKVAVLAIPQSKVTDLVAALAGKQPLAAALTTLATNNGINLTGLNATNLASGTVPDARFPATLPAASGVNLTALNATNLASGTVPDARFPATLPAASGVNLTALNATNLASGTVAGARLGTLLSVLVTAGQQTAVADVNQSAMPASISGTYDQTEVAGLRTVLLDTIAQLEALRDRLKETGGNGLLADA